jgi:hypothetical protein
MSCRTLCLGGTATSYIMDRLYSTLLLPRTLSNVASYISGTSNVPNVIWKDALLLGMSVARRRRRRGSEEATIRTSGTGLRQFFENAYSRVVDSRVFLNGIVVRALFWRDDFPLPAPWNFFSPSRTCMHACMLVKRKMTINLPIVLDSEDDVQLQQRGYMYLFPQGKVL